GFSGKVKNPGVWEVPFGITARELLEEYAGGMRDGYQLKCWQPGGAGTGFLLPEHLDAQMYAGGIGKVGTRMGTGLALAVDHTVNMVSLLRNMEEFFARESCGWCTPCRDGLPWSVKTLRALERGEGRPEDLDILHGLVSFLGPGRTFCAHAPGAVEPLGSAIRYFRDEFEAGVAQRRTLNQAQERTSAMATSHVDGKAYEVDGADNLLHACLSLGLDIPYFCWHPALHSVGACRQCAVRQFSDENDTRGRLVMSCMTPAADNTWISIDDEEARAFRASVIEWLMINHPHDCPVCEEGGHCHLQDMTVMTGHNRRRYRFTKRTHRNQYLGPFIAHEMNRCIACYRCVRYYGDYAGGTDLGVFGAHDNVYFGRVEDGVLESEFSGNLTEVCPTGVFTDLIHSERYTRKWDMQYAPSICHACSAGCNISPGERYGEIRRIENRFNGAVNHYFLCDRGRFGYGFVNRK